MQRTQGAASSPTTLLQVRLSPPPLGSQLIQREDLLERVCISEPRVVLACAPAGYGKTAFLSQLAARVCRPVAWVTLDGTDNDPLQLVTELATALDRCAPLDPTVFSALLSTEPALFADVLPRLMNCLARGKGGVLILDDAHVVTARRSVEVLEYLCHHLPRGLQLVLGARQLPELPIAQLRAHGVLLELGPRELSLSREQARAVCARVGTRVSPEAFDHLYEQTEGWPTGVFLAALTARDASDPDRAAREFDGADRSVVDFFLSEHLAAEEDDRVAFLQATSVFERLSAPLCDAVLERDDSATVLGAMEQSHGFIIALDRRRQWYRYHHLFRLALQAELALHDPGRTREIHARASRWYASQGEYQQAIEHALSARDEHRVADLLAQHLQTLFDDTPQATLCRWLQSLPDADLVEHPPLAAAGAWLMLQLGDVEKTRRYMRVLAGGCGLEHAAHEGRWPLGETSGQSAVALLNAALGWNGVSHIVRSAQQVQKSEAPVSRTFRVASLFLGANLLLRERRAAARDLLEDAAEIGPAALDVGAIAQALLALIDLEERRYPEAEAWVSLAQARLDLAGLNASLASAPLLAARAWLDLVRNDRAAASASLEQAATLLARTQIVPWLAISVQIVLGRLALELDDPALATALLAAARRGLTRHPDAGFLPHLLASAERAQEASLGGSRALLEPLTQAELRVLELAPTCLSIEEIGRTLTVSKNTIKTHLKAIYAKLAVASRSEAVDRARELRLIA
jgi:LuxR family maltose regulon positive regulatory protein